MNKIFTLLLVFVFFTSCSNGQDQLVTKLFKEVDKDLLVLLPKGSVSADIMDGVYQDPKQIALTQKVQTAIKSNSKWFMEYLKTIPPGSPMPYHTNLGVSKEEYAELMGFMDHIQMISTGTEVIEIKNVDGVFHFRSKNRLSAFDSLKIDLKNKVALYKGIKLPYSDTVNITTDKNGLKSKWFGYVWKLEEPADLDPANMGDISTLKLKQYKVTIGRLEANGKTYFSLKGREIVNGVKLVDFELPVLF